MTVGLNITEACIASHGCFLLLLRPEPLQRKERALCLPSLGLNAAKVLEDKLPDSSSIRQLQFADFEGVDPELNCNKKRIQSRTKV